MIATATGRFRLLPTQAKCCLLRIVAFSLNTYCEDAGLRPEEQCSFRHARLTVDMLFVVRRLQELG